MAVNLRQIAEKTNLSISTVSRVLNGRNNHANEKTRNQILAVANELGYQPHAGARALVRGRSESIAVLVPEMRYYNYIMSIESLLASDRLRVIPMATHWSAEHEAAVLRSLPRGAYDALLNLHYIEENDALYKQMAQQGHRLVFRLSNVPVEKVEFDCVGTDIPTAGGKLIEHFHDQGYSKIGIVGGFCSQEISNGDFDGYHAKYYSDAYRRLGLDLRPAQAIPCDEADPIDAYHAVTKALQDRADCFDALVVQSDAKLLGVFKAVEKAGLRPGKDIGIACIADVNCAEAILLDCTIWALPVERICQGLVHLLKTRIEKADAPLQKIHYESSLLARASSSRD